MKHFTLLLFLFAFAGPLTISAQLADGSIAPNFTHNDIEGVEHTLYDYLDEGKMVVLKFSATWCGPCWNYMLTGALEDFWYDNGPSGSNEGYAFYIESDQTTGMDDLLGLTNESQGNWVANIPHPIIDLQFGENTDNDYQIGYYPTLYAVCSDYKVYELGQVPFSVWDEFIESCKLAGVVDNIVEATCFGDGAVELDVQGGVTPIDYDWSNGTHGATLENVGAGVYSVTITEANGKDVVIENIVIEGAETPIELANADIDPALCFNSSTGNVSVELEAGVEPYDYNWSNGDQDETLSDVPAGTYTLNATDSNGCPFEETFEVTEPDELLASYETTPEYCDQGDGTIMLDIDGGVGNYTLSSSEGDIDDNLIYNLPAGVTTAIVEDGNGCVWTENIEIEYSPQHEIFFSPDPEITCVQPTTEVQGFVTGGFDDYEYTWSTTNGNIIGATDQPIIVVDEAGDYNLEVYDIFSGCTALNSVAVTSTGDLPEVEAGDDTPISCELLEPILQATGDLANQVSWSTIDGNILSGGDTYTPTVDAPGTYTITVINPSNSCTNVDEVIVLNELAPADAQYQYQSSGLTIAGTDVSTGSNLSGWAWTFGDGNTSNEQNPIHTYAEEGSFEICLSVQNGCGQSSICQTVQVTIDGSQISVIDNIQHVSCHSGTNGSITVIVNGGTGNYTFTWTGPEGEIYNTQSISDLPTGIYHLEISDDEGNLFSGDYTVNQPNIIELSGSTIIDNLCFGESNGSLSIDIIGGVSPYLYSFNGDTLQVENIITGLPAGVVEGVITDANGCLFTAGPYTIQEPAVVDNLTIATGVSCFGDTNGAIAITTQGGVAPYSYLWDVLGITTPDITGLAPGTYICAITDNNGCASAVSVDVLEPAVLDVANVTATNPTGTEQNNGSINIDVIGGTAPYAVTWSNGANGSLIENLEPGEYTYTVVDANGCSLATSDPIILSGTVSNNYVPWAEFISIAPNPSKGDVNVTWEGLSGNQGTITLNTLQGKQLLVEKVTSSAGVWSLSQYNLASGVYIILFEMDNEAVPYKLVVF